MLAPLKDRSLIEQESVASLVDENTLLQQSFRQSRQMQKRAASLAARKIVALTNEMLRLDEHNRLLRARLQELESGVAMTAMAQRLLALQDENDRLRDASQRLWFLDRTLCAAHRECERLTQERDVALRHLHDLGNNPQAS